MKEIQKFMDDCYDFSRWYHNRTDERKQFDKIVLQELSCGKKIQAAVKDAALQIPDIGTTVLGRTISELNDYYSQLQRMEQEIAIANNIRALIALRRKKTQ